MDINLWQTKKLGEVCTIIAGQSPASSYYNFAGKGLPFYQGKKEFGHKYINSPRVWTIKIKKTAQTGDVLMSVRAPVGAVNIATEKICIGRGLAALRVGSEIDRYFLYYFLLSKQRTITTRPGAVFESINRNDIEAMDFHFPSLDKQRQIVSALDVLSDNVIKLESVYSQKIVALEELRQSFLRQSFMEPV